MSLGGGFDEYLNEAVQSLTNSGCPVVAAAGNEGDDACYHSPSSALSAITVGATDIAVMLS